MSRSLLILCLAIVLVSAGNRKEHNKNQNQNKDAMYTFQVADDAWSQNLTTQTCATVTIQPIPIPGDFPGYDVDCTLGTPGCSRWFNDPLESFIDVPGQGHVAGASFSDMDTAWITWNDTNLFLMLQTIANDYNGDPTGTQCLTLSASRIIAVCIDVIEIDSSACPGATGGVWNNVCGGDGPSDYDFAFWLKWNGQTPVDYSNINIYYQPKVDMNHNCVAEVAVPPALVDPGVEWYTPNGIQERPFGVLFPETCNNPLGNLTEDDPLSRQTFFNFPGRLIGNPAVGSTVKVYAYMDNSQVEGDDLAPADPVNLAVPTPAQGAELILGCPTTPPPTDCPPTTQPPTSQPPAPSSMSSQSMMGGGMGMAMHMGMGMGMAMHMGGGMGGGMSMSSGSGSMGGAAPVSMTTNQTMTTTSPQQGMNNGKIMGMGGKNLREARKVMGKSSGSGSTGSMTTATTAPTDAPTGNPACAPTTAAPTTSAPSSSMSSQSMMGGGMGMAMHMGMGMAMHMGGGMSMSSGSGSMGGAAPVSMTTNQTMTTTSPQQGMNNGGKVMGMGMLYQN